MVKAAEALCKCPAWQVGVDSGLAGVLCLLMCSRCTSAGAIHLCLAVQIRHGLLVGCLVSRSMQETTNPSCLPEAEAAAGV